MRVCYVGNHGSKVGLGAEVAPGQTPATTETHWAHGLEALGHQVVRVEEETTPWADRLAVALDCDLLLWTSTRGFDERWPRDEGFAVLAELRRAGIPSACVHLDRWRGLANREWQVTDPARSSAMFAVDYCFTADGDADDWFAAHGVSGHHWLPPGVHEPECVPGTPREEWRSDVAFIGGWQDYGHAEHAATRMAMLDALREHFGERVAFWPKRGQSGPWGLAYNDLIASTKVVVGDGWRGARRYWSNRCVEVVGRQGFMVHPWIEGLAERMPEGCGIAYYRLGDYRSMCDIIEWWVTHDVERDDARNKGHAHVLAGETYTHRMQQVIDVVRRS